MEKDGNRAVVSKQAIRAGEVICRVPASAAWLVSFDEPPAVPDSFVSQTFWNSVDVQEKEKWWFVKLAVRLLYERSLGDQSNWAPYVSMMPSHVETLVHFSSQSLRLPESMTVEGPGQSPVCLKYGLGTSVSQSTHLKSGNAFV